MNEGNEKLAVFFGDDSSFRKKATDASESLLLALHSNVRRVNLATLPFHPRRWWNVMGSVMTVLSSKQDTRFTQIDKTALAIFLVTGGSRGQREPEKAADYVRCTIYSVYIASAVSDRRLGGLLLLAYWRDDEPYAALSAWNRARWLIITLLLERPETLRQLLRGELSDSKLEDLVPPHSMVSAPQILDHREEVHETLANLCQMVGLTMPEAL